MMLSTPHGATWKISTQYMLLKQTLQVMRGRQICYGELRSLSLLPTCLSPWQTLPVFLTLSIEQN